MATRSMGPATGWSWLVRAVNLGSQNPRALFGAASLMLVIALVPTVLQMLLTGGDAAAAPSPAAMGGWMLFTLLYSVLVMPPAMAGFLRVIHASETGAPIRATAIFDGYRQGAGRIIGVVLALMAVAIVVVVALVALIGPDIVQAVVEAMAAAQGTPGGKPQLPSLPDGFGTLFVLLLLFGLFFNGVYALSVGQVALGSRGVGEALRDGFAGALKNLLPLLVLLLVALVIGLVVGLVLALLMGLLAMLGALVHPTLGMLLAAPVYLLAMLAVYVIAFGVMYFMWRDICADGAALPAERNDQVEL